ncbi:hypothetical protein [Streptomyces cylindrosporus]|uniref:Uncharacterized protein n=1 Tax=Streptomyces cylindrosporus TaxID=2927583 RepID=A0ABS9YL14_9ACTN|nr:hypothetical protein [Streptomyces cylindrosporus]MCI3277962.1 hypothetical protein [Streptomyces cylindrosporus]
MTLEPAFPTWPLVVVDVSERTGDEAPAAVAGALGAAVETARARREGFAAVVQMPSTVRRGPRPAAATERVRMLRRLRPGLAESCRGLAFVVSAEVQRANAKAIRAGARLWGCPTYTVDTVVAAQAWAREQLKPSGDPGDGRDARRARGGSGA